MSSKSKNPVVDFIVTAITLFLIASLVAVLLAVANYFTAPIIEKSAKERLNQCLNGLMEDAVRFDQIDDYATVETAVPVLAIYRGMNKEDAPIGYCIHVAPNGYSDTIEMMVAIDNEGAVSGVQILSISDTPGIGMKVQSDEDFQKSALGHSENIKVVKNLPANPNEVQVISGATISSTGYLDGINAAIDAVRYLEGEVAAK